MSPPRPRLDFLSATRARLEGLADSEVLSLAASQRRVLVSHDFQTMPAHFGEYLRSAGSSPGVILVPQHLPVALAIEDLVLIWSISGAEEWTDRIIALPL
jgi:hypothetical protein